MQAAGREFAARKVSYRATGDAAELHLDLAAAYPAEAGIKSWERVLRLDRASNQVRVRDSYLLAKAGGQVTLTLMTPCTVTASAAGRLILTGGFLKKGKVEIEFPELMRVSTESVATLDPRLQAIWGDRIFRVLLAAENLPAQGEFVIRIAQA
jgi:hypothetical protein